MSTSLINVEKALDWGYDKALDGLPGMETSEELARSYLRQSGSLESRVDSLIRWQNAKCATSGFITGLGGIITLPVAIPANLASTLYVQLRMIAAIAYMGGYNIRDDQVRSLAFICLCGNAVNDVMKKIGTEVGKVLTKNAIKNISTRQIQKIVGRQIITKTVGSKGIINLSKAIPIAGGIIGGAMDGFYTNAIGNAAKKVFIEN